MATVDSCFRRESTFTMRSYEVAPVVRTEHSAGLHFDEPVHRELMHEMRGRPRDAVLRDRDGVVDASVLRPLHERRDVGRTVDVSVRGLHVPLSRIFHCAYYTKSARAEKRRLGLFEPQAPQCGIENRIVLLRLLRGLLRRSLLRGSLLGRRLLCRSLLRNDLLRRSLLSGRRLLCRSRLLRRGSLLSAARLLGAARLLRRGLLCSSHFLILFLFRTRRRGRATATSAVSIENDTSFFRKAQGEILDFFVSP